MKQDVEYFLIGMLSGAVVVELGIIGMLIFLILNK